jgi:transposase-like protein
MARPSDVTPEQRAEIVLALLRREEPTAILARRYGISTNTLNQWKDDFIAAGTSGLASGKRRKAEESRRMSDLEHAVTERDRVIGELTIANMILKKMVPSSPRSWVPKGSDGHVCIRTRCQADQGIGSAGHYPLILVQSSCCRGAATQAWPQWQIYSGTGYHRGPRRSWSVPYVGLQEDRCCVPP